MGMQQRGMGVKITIPIPGAGTQDGGYTASNSTIPTPGVCIQVGNGLVGVPDGTFAAGTSGNVTLHLQGEFNNMLLKTGDAPAIGDNLYWDNANYWLTVTAGSLVKAGRCSTLPSIVTISGTPYTVCGIILRS